VSTPCSQISRLIGISSLGEGEQLLDGFGGFAGFELGDGESVGSGTLGKFALGQPLSLARSAQRTPQRGR
jgi:hypothetical protein